MMSLSVYLVPCSFQGVCSSGPMFLPGGSWSGGPHSKTPLHGKERVVPILLECILVQWNFTQDSLGWRGCQKLLNIIRKTFWFWNPTTIFLTLSMPYPTHWLDMSCSIKTRRGFGVNSLPPVLPAFHVVWHNFISISMKMHQVTNIFLNTVRHKYTWQKVLLSINLFKGKTKQGFNRGG